MISDYSPILPVSFGASCRTRTFSLSVLLQSATVPPQELASIRTEFSDNTAPEKDFNRSFKERSPSAQWTFRKMILSFGARPS